MEYKFLNSKEASRKDVAELLVLLENYFETAHNPDQMQINDEARDWVGKNIPECSTLIKHDGKVIGSVFVMPCTLKIMNEFVSKKISEARLAEEIREWGPNYEKMECVYLCSAFVAPEHRGKGLAFRSAVRTIRGILGDRKLPLFYWGYSEEGKNLAERVAKEFGVKIYARKS